MSDRPTTAGIVARAALLSVAFVLGALYGLAWMDDVAHGGIRRGEPASVLAAVPRTAVRVMTDVLPAWWLPAAGAVVVLTLFGAAVPLALTRRDDT